MGIDSERREPQHPCSGSVTVVRCTRSVQRHGSIYTALETVIHAERLGLEVVTTPVTRPESNGMSEAFVNTLRRDYIESAELWSAASVIAQLPAWFRDYNEVAPHSALGMKSPRQFRAEQTLSASL